MRRPNAGALAPMAIMFTERRHGRRMLAQKNVCADHPVPVAPCGQPTVINLPTDPQPSPLTLLLICWLLSFYRTLLGSLDILPLLLSIHHGAVALHHC